MRRSGRGRGFWRGFLHAEFHQHDVEYWRKEETEERDADHPGEHRDAHRTTHLRAGAGGDDERENAGDEGDARHQDRAQTQAARFDRGVDRRRTFVLFVLGELDDQDRILARETDEDDEADLREDVVVATAEPHARNGEEQAQRHDENDRERQPEAFVLRGEHEEHEQDAERIDVNRRVAGEDALVGELGPFEGHAFRERVGRELRHRCFGFHGADARCRATGDLRGRIAVVAHDAVGAVGLLHLDERAERNHLSGGVAGFQTRDVLGAIAELRVGLRDDLPGTAEEVEVIHVERAEVDLHRLEQILQGHALRLGLHAIDLGVELRDVHGEGGEDAGEFARGVALSDEPHGVLEERVVAEAGAILDVHFESANGTDVDRGRHDGEDERFRDAAELAVQRGRDGRAGEVGRLALFKVLQAEEDDAGIRRDAEAADAEPRELHGAFHAGNLQPDLAHAPHHGIGAIERRAFRQLSEGDEVLLVLRGDEAGRNFREAPAGEIDESRVEDESDEALAQHAAHRRAVFVARPRERAIKRAEDPAEHPVHDPRDDVLRSFVIPEQHCGERGRKRERVERGDDGRDGDGDGELLVELAGQAADERRGNEHRAEDKSDGDDRAGDFVHRLLRRLER